MKSLSLFFWILWTGGTAFATLIDWYCVPHSGNMTVAGEPMGGEFRFELGVFRDGFTPTANNMGEWAENWLPAQRALYHEENQWFTHRYRVESNEDGFSAGKEAWMWGFAGGPANGEWILFRGDSWRWPRAGGTSPLPLNWRASDATRFLIGGATGGGGLQAEAVEGGLPPTTSWAQWREEVLGERANREGDDLNENGVPDLIEFVMGTEGAETFLASRLEVRRVNEQGTTHLELVIPRRADRPALFELEISPDLENWMPAASVVTLHREDPHELVYRDIAGTSDLEGAWFWRYKIRPQE